jgi:biopolymer transport protein ExbB
MISFAVALERLLYYRRRNADVDRVLERSLEALRRSDLPTALALCEDCVHPLGSVAPEVLAEPGANRHAAEEKLQILLSQQKLLLERNVGLLGTMAAVAPLVGLLGTVWGIMRAFHDMSQTGSAAPTVVAAGVAEALLTTAAGLIVAVPSVMLFNWFNRRMNVMLTVAENHARTLRNAMETALAARIEGSEIAPGGVRRARDETEEPVAERVVGEARDIVGNLVG